MNKQYPVGKAQQMVLDALHITATGASDAKDKFEALGIAVGSKREGRTSIPQIAILPRQGGGFNADGEGEVWQQYRKLTVAEFDAIKSWVIGEVPSDAVEQPEPVKTVEPSQIKAGDRIVVKAHTAYKHLEVNAVIKPAKSYEVPEHVTTVRNVFQDEMEDADGNPYMEYTILTSAGEELPFSHVLDEVMTAAEVQKEFGLAEPTVRQAINRGTLPARKSGETWLVLRKDAEARWGKKQ